MEKANRSQKSAAVPDADRVAGLATLVPEYRTRHIDPTETLIEQAQAAPGDVAERRAGSTETCHTCRHNESHARQIIGIDFTPWWYSPEIRVPTASARAPEADPVADPSGACSCYLAIAERAWMTRDHAACDQLDGCGDTAGLREQQCYQNQDLHSTCLGGRSGTEEHADERSRQRDQADGPGGIEVRQ